MLKSQDLVKISFIILYIPKYEPAHVILVLIALVNNEDSDSAAHTWADQEGGTGGRDPPPIPLENHKWL